MSNFICPHCQQIIDDGSDGFTSNREIELEKKLEIAVEFLAQRGMTLEQWLKQR